MVVSPASVRYLWIVEGLSKRRTVMRELSSRIAASRNPSEAPECARPSLSERSAAIDIDPRFQGCEVCPLISCSSAAACFCASQKSIL